MEGTLLAPDEVLREQVEEVLSELASGDKDQFGEYFFHLHRAYPRESVRGCLRHFSTWGADSPAASLALPWLIQKNYFELLLDAQFLSLDAARRAARVLREHDPRFFQYFHHLSDGTATAEACRALSRALLLLEGAGDHAVLFPWLRGLTRYPDLHIQSQATKALVRIRANAAVVARQLSAEDPRVRANAVEALWHSQAADAESFFHRALGDVHHRVVVNALVGLHFQGDESAMARLTEYLHSGSDGYRLAAVWAFGYLADTKGIPALKLLLAGEIAPALRASAEKALATLTASPLPA